MEHTLKFTILYVNYTSIKLIIFKKRKKNPTLNFTADWGEPVSLDFQIWAVTYYSQGIQTWTRPLPWQSTLQMEEQGNAWNSLVGSGCHPDISSRS